MGRNLGILMVLALTISSMGCGTFRVQTDWDREASFEELQRFQWVEPPKREDANPFADNSLLRKRVRVALEGTLAERGYREVETAGEADFLVTYSVILDERLRVDGVSSSYGGGFGRGTAGYGSAYSTANVRGYQESTLIIDVLDPTTEALLWRGWGMGIVRTRDRNRSRLDEGVRAILDKFPPERK